MGKKSRRAKQPKNAPAAIAKSASHRDDFASPPPPPGASCWICLDGDPDGEGKPLVRDCSCRGDSSGFAHVSCLTQYAGRKSKDFFGSMLSKGIHTDREDYMNWAKPWQNCPQCLQKYERQVALDMAKSLIGFTDENYPGFDVPKVEAYYTIVDTAMDGVARYEQQHELREVAKEAALKMISIIEEMNQEFQHIGGGRKAFVDRLSVAYCHVGTLAEAEGTEEGRETALHYYQKLRDLYSSNQRMANMADRLIEKVKGCHNGKETKRSSSEQALHDTRSWYEEIMRTEGEDSYEAVQTGMCLAKALRSTGGHLLECERLLTKVVATSQRIHGPHHPTTKEAMRGLEVALQRWVFLTTKNGFEKRQLLHMADDEERYVLHIPGQKPDVRTVAMDKLSLPIGMPVVCHGLKSASHVNGKLGDVRNFNGETGRYMVRFEDRSLQPAWVKSQNLRIVFDLPDEEV